MHTVELLEQATATLRQLGYRIREECIGDIGGGSCVLRGQKWFFLDPTLDLTDQLELACDALSTDPALGSVSIPDGLAGLLRIRKSA